MSFKSISDFHNQTLDKIVETIGQQKNLLSLVRQALPDELAINVVSCAIRDDTLIIYTHAAAWASQLRFYQTAILDAVKPSITTLKRVQIRLQF